MHSSMIQSDKKHFVHPFTSLKDHQDGTPHCMDHAEGIYIYDDQGNKYIDAMAGLWCVNVGYGQERLSRAIYEASKKLSYYHAFMSTTNEAAVKLSEELADITPGNINKAFFCNSGSEANDTHVKLVQYYNNLRGKPQKKKFIARKGAYHGVTLVAASLSGLPHMHKAFDILHDGFMQVSRPSHYWEAPTGMSEQEFSQHLAQELEQLILAEGPDTVAAFIAEPIMGAAGVIVPPEGYFDAIVPILRKYDVLFIADEVICGFGRLGVMFGSDYYKMQPDLMTIAKGLTSGYFPMAACLIGDHIWQTLYEASAEAGPFGHGFTYSAHPVAAAAGLANLDIIKSDGLVENAAEAGAYFQKRLEETVFDHPLVGEKRGVGLIAGVELVADREKKVPFDLSIGAAKRVYMKLLEEGLICRPIMNTLTFSPPLILTKNDVDDMLERFSRGLDKGMEQLVRDGIWRSA